MNPDTEWSTREKLAIASYVLRSGEQHWSGVGRLLRPLGEPNRPSYWFSPKFCAQQYTALLENEDDLPKRKRNTERTDSSENPATPATKEELIVRRLTKERIDELKRQLRHDRAQYRKRKQELEMVESGSLDDKLEEIWDNMLKEEYSQEVEDEISDPKSEETEKASKENEEVKKELEEIAKDAELVIEDIKSKLEELAEHPQEEEDAQMQQTSDEAFALSQAEDHKDSEDIPENPPVTEKDDVEPMQQEDDPVKLDSVENQEAEDECTEKEEETSLETQDPPDIDEKLQDNAYVAVDPLPDIQSTNSNASNDSESKKESSHCENEEPEKAEKDTNEKDIEQGTSDRLVTTDAFVKLEDLATGIDKTTLDTVTKPEDSTPTEDVKEEDSGGSSDELNVEASPAALPKATTVEDSADLIEENESMYNYSIDEESSYQQQSQPGTPLQFSCDSFPSSPALSHSSDLDPETIANCKAWRKSIMILWKQVASHRYASLFLQPVTDDIAPNYSTTVYRTMDLSTLKKNIENGAIRTTSEFQRDLMLMFQNAIMYNNREHDVYKMTMEMQKDVMDQVAQFLATQLMVETAQPASNKSLRRSTMRRSAINSDKISEARSKRVAAIEGEARLMRKKQPSHE